jgi:hypothetical protein
MRFESKRDPWVVFVTRAFPFLLLAVLAAVEHNMRGVIGGLITLTIVELLLVGPIMRATYYVIEGDTLMIRSGIAKWRVPIRDIRSISPTRSVLSSPALSLDRLSIEYGRKTIMISPEEKQRFIEALRTINPSIVA